MNLRFLIAAAALLPAGASYAQENCTAEGFDRTCADNTITFCDTTDDQGAPLAQPVTATLDCATIADGAVGVGCGEAPCTGAGCGDNTNCIGTGEGSTCIGESVFYVDADGDGQADNADSFLAVMCADGFACETVVADNGGQLTIADTCTATTETCTAAAARCDGQVAVTCYAAEGANGPLLLTRPTLQDCATFPDSECVVDDSGAQPFAFCGSAEGEGEGEGEEGEGEEGEGEGNGRDDDGPAEPPPSGCPLLNATGAVPSFGTLAVVLGAMMIVRRRRR